MAAPISISFCVKLLLAAMVMFRSPHLRNRHEAQTHLLPSDLEKSGLAIEVVPNAPPGAYDLKLVP
jgi:hypothetical protein